MVKVTVQIMRQFFLQRFKLFRSISQIALKFGHLLQVLQHLLCLLVVFEVRLLHHRLEVRIIGICNFKLLC